MKTVLAVVLFAAVAIGLPPIFESPPSPQHIICTKQITMQCECLPGEELCVEWYTCPGPLGGCCSQTKTC